FERACVATAGEDPADRGVRCVGRRVKSRAEQQATKKAARSAMGPSGRLYCKCSWEVGRLGIEPTTSRSESRYLSGRTRGGRLSAPFTAPEFRKSSFNCPQCGAFAQQYWFLAFKTLDDAGVPAHFCPIPQMYASVCAD